MSEETTERTEELETEPSLEPDPTLDAADLAAYTAPEVPDEGLMEAADEALFGMHGATEGSTQWRITSLQLVNWGGFGGHHVVPLHSETTLLTGASGVGKSSLLDAWTTLMMPSDTRLNGASNDVAPGRARSAGQRSPLSYLRGVVDQAEDRAGGGARQVTLRGSDEDTWGAVAATFVDDRQRRFTVLRIFYVPRRATRTSDVLTRLATVEGELDLSDLQQAVGSRFAPRELRALFPRLQCHETYAVFAARLHARLGIGANGDGDKALRLLARIQASQPVRSVDELYKEMVLERPATYAAADRAVEHFDDLEASYETMVTEQQKSDLLAPIEDHHRVLVAAQDRIGELDAYGATSPGPSPLRLWELRRHAGLLAEAVRANQAARETNRDRRASIARKVADLQVELSTAREAHRGAGGETLELLGAELKKEQARAEELAERRDRLAPRAAVLGVDLTSAESYAAAQAEGRSFLAGYDAELARLEDGVVDVARRQGPLLERRAELRKDRASLAGRRGRVPRELDEIRRLLAETAGLTTAELPFLAELIEVRPDEERWRTAVETVLGGVARQLLVPADELRDFSAAIDHLDLPRRITFVGADLDVDPPTPGSADRISGKLDHQDGPFAGWVRWYLADPSRDALCVESAADLDGGGFRVTLAGQTRSGRRGSHGRSGGADIIGFSNTEALAAVDAALGRIEDQLDGLDRERTEVASRKRAAEARVAAYQAIADIPFADLDVASSQERCDELSAQRERVLGSDAHLRTLAGQVDEIEAAMRAAEVERTLAADERAELEQEHARLVDAEDACHDELDRVEQAATLGEEQAARLDAEFAAAVGPGVEGSLDRFAENCSRLRDRLGEAARTASEQIAAASRELVRIFGLYAERWPDPNRGTALTSYRDYADILAEIRRTGLADRREEWRRRLADWSGQDLVPLAGAMAAAIEDIEDRLAPINDILRRLPFGAGSDRLRIRIRRLTPTEVTLFLGDLRELSQGTGERLAGEQLEARFVRLQRFMAQLRTADDPRAGAAEARLRDALLDVRRHVEVSAERYDPRTGAHQAWYRTLGEKSGGESQELIAFVIGAALRFRLGDELRSRPRFAPVFLDEGFVKADAEFAGRAVAAWKGLGFQLVVGAPFDKFTGLERHMDEFLEVVKNPATNAARVRRVVDATSV